MGVSIARLVCSASLHTNDWVQALLRAGARACLVAGGCWMLVTFGGRVSRRMLFVGGVCVGSAWVDAVGGLVMVVWVVWVWAWVGGWVVGV